MDRHATRTVPDGCGVPRQHSLGALQRIASFGHPIGNHDLVACQLREEPFAAAGVGRRIGVHVVVPDVQILAHAVLQQALGKRACTVGHRRAQHLLGWIDGSEAEKRSFLHAAHSPDGCEKKKMSGSFQTSHACTRPRKFWATPGQNDTRRASRPAPRVILVSPAPGRNTVEDLVHVDAVLVENRGRAIVATPVVLAARPLHLAPRQPFAHARDAAQLQQLGQRLPLVCPTSHDMALSIASRLVPRHALAGSISTTSGITRVAGHRFVIAGRQQPKSSVPASAPRRVAHFLTRPVAQWHGCIAVARRQCESAPAESHTNAFGKTLRWTAPCTPRAGTTARSLGGHAARHDATQTVPGRPIAACPLANSEKAQDGIAASRWPA